MSEIIIGKNILNASLGDTNNSVLLTIGDNSTGDTEGGYAQQFQQSGFCSLPPDAVPGVSASECVLLKGYSNRDIVIATRDVLSQKLYANMNPGDVIVYGGGPTGTGQARVKCNGTTGSVSLMTTTTNDPTGTFVQMTVSPTSWSFFAPWGKFIFDATGVHYTLASGASFHLGTLNASLGPIGLNSYCQINSDLTTLSSSTIKLGASAAFLAPVLAPTPSVTPGTPALVPVVTPVTGQGITSTTIFIGI